MKLLNFFLSNLWTLLTQCWGSKFALRGRLGWNGKRGVRVKLGGREKELSSFDPKTYFSFPSCHRLDIERKCGHVEDWLSRGNDSIACQSSTYTLNMIRSIHIHLSSTRIASQNKMKAKESWRMPIRFLYKVRGLAKDCLDTDIGGRQMQEYRWYMMRLPEKLMSPTLISLSWFDQSSSYAEPICLKSHFQHFPYSKKLLHLVIYLGLQTWKCSDKLHEFC